MASTVEGSGGHGPRRLYGLRQHELGSRMYYHDSGAIVLRTDGWEGARSDSLQRWEIGQLDPDGTPVVGYDGRLFRTLREAAGVLDAEAILARAVAGVAPERCEER